MVFHLILLKQRVAQPSEIAPANPLDIGQDTLSSNGVQKESKTQHKRKSVEHQAEANPRLNTCQKSPGISKAKIRKADHHKEFLTSYSAKQQKKRKFSEANSSEARVTADVAASKRKHESSLPHDCDENLGPS